MTADPAAVLTPVSAPEFDLYEFVFEKVGIPSGPITAVFALLDAFGIDPLGDLAESLAGDWRPYDEAAQAYKKLAGFYDELHGAVNADLSTMLNYWHGVAGDHASAFFTTELPKLLEAQDYLTYVSNQLDSMQQELRVYGNLIAVEIGLFLGLCDAVLVVWKFPPAVAIAVGIAATQFLRILDLFLKVRDGLVTFVAAAVSFGSPDAPKGPPGTPAVYDNPVLT